MWTGRQIAILWSVAVLLIAVAWGVAYFTGILPSTGETFVVLWVLASAGPAVATWQWARSGGDAVDDTVREEEGNGPGEEAR